MKILIACECSGRARDAFLSRGHDAISCDLKPTRRPGPHYHGDVRDILGDAWDMLIAHPVCKYLANSGAKHLYRRINGVWAKENGAEPERWRLMEEGAKFFNLFRDAKHIPMRAVENSIMHGHAIKLVGRTADQYIQPWMFGDAYTKAAGLWLYGLPKLNPQYKKSWYADRGIEIKPACWMMPPSEDREEKRSETYPGIAQAFAEQWGHESLLLAAQCQKFLGPLAPGLPLNLPS